MLELRSSAGGKGGAVLERRGGVRSTLTGDPGELGSEYSAMGDAYAEGGVDVPGLSV